MRYGLLLILTVCGMSSAHDTDGTELTYLGNSGVFVTHGDLQIAFDPLYRNDFATYELVPPALESKFFAAEQPFDGLDAIFVSHHHGDHFSATLMVDMMRRNPKLLLFAPQQAVAAMHAVDDIASLESRVHAVKAELGEKAQVFQASGLQVDVIRVPHSGWPDRMADVENLVWRVHLTDSGAVTHFGDATTNRKAFLETESFWSQSATTLAFPPYWFFLTAEGQYILQNIVQAQHTIGVHVPKDIADNAADRPAELQDATLLTRPGETLSFKDEEL